MQKALTLESGAKLVINHVSLASAFKLKRLVSRELLKVNLSFSDAMIPAIMSKNRNNVIAALSGTEVNSLKDALLSLLGSEEIDEALVDCMLKWTLDGKPIKFETFEPDERRGDLYPCALEVAKEALLPFFSHLGFESSTPETETKPSPG